MLEKKQRPTRAYWEAYNGLYAKGDAQDAKGDGQLETIPKKRKKPSNDEYIEQVILCTWLDKIGVLYYAIPNGGKRNPIEAIKLKRGGVKAGIPDLCITLSRKGYHGLYIELKRKDGGVVSESQKFWLAKLTSEGYMAVIARGAEDAKKIVINYLGE